MIVSVRQLCTLVASLAVWSWKAFDCADHLTCIEKQGELIFGLTTSLNLNIPLRELPSRQIIVAEGFFKTRQLCGWFKTQRLYRGFLSSAKKYLSVV